MILNHMQKNICQKVSHKAIKELAIKYHLDIVSIQNYCELHLNITIKQLIEEIVRQIQYPNET